MCQPSQMVAELRGGAQALPRLAARRYGRRSAAQRRPGDGIARTEQIQHRERAGVKTLRDGRGWATSIEQKHAQPAAGGGDRHGAAGRPGADHDDIPAQARGHA